MHLQRAVETSDHDEAPLAAHHAAQRDKGGSNDCEAPVTKRPSAARGKARRSARSRGANIPLRSDVIDDVDRVLKLSDPSGALGTTARYWINVNLPDLARRYLDSPSEVCILDLGCGDGPNADLLADAGLEGQYVGVDIKASPAWQSRMGTRGLLHRSFKTADARDIASVGTTFSGVVSVSAFEHFVDDRYVARELARVVKPGGRAIIIVPSTWGAGVWGFQHGFRRYSPKSFHDVVAGSGFIVREVLPGGGFASVVVNTTWQLIAVAVSRIVLSILLIRTRSRRSVKLRYPWTKGIVTRVKFAHLNKPGGRRLHGKINAVLLSANRKFPSCPEQWVFVLERQEDDVRATCL